MTMKKTIGLCVAAMVIGVAGCACVPPVRVSTVHLNKFDADVEVVNGVPEAPEVLRFGQGVKGTITWHLKDKDYRFRLKDGIAFDANAAGEIINCRRENNEMKFSCDNLHGKDGQGRFYKYHVNIEDSKGNLLTKDPFVLND